MKLSLPSRDDVQAWLTKPGRGVEFGELWSAAASFFYAWRSVDVFDGRLVAPLTSRVFLGAYGGFLYWVLMLNCFVVGAAMIWGLVTGNTYKTRSYLSFASSVMWVFVAFIASIAQLPFSVSSAYVVSCIVSFLTSIVLLALARMPGHKPSKVLFRLPRRLLMQGGF